MTTTVLKDQAAATRLAIAELEERSREQAERTAIATALSRARNASDSIALALVVRQELSDAGAALSSISSSRRKDAAEGRTGLRRAATLLADPSRQLTALLNGQSVQNSLKHAEEVCRALESTLRAAVEAQRVALRPADLERPIPEVPGHSRTVFTLRRAKDLLIEPVQNVPLPLLPQRLTDLRDAATNWQQLRPQLDAEVEALAPALRLFVEAATSENGASWALVVDEVRNWLDEGHGESYRVTLI